MESIIGQKYYKFDLIDGEPLLKTFTIESELKTFTIESDLDLYPESPLRYYSTKENHKQDEGFKSILGVNYFCDKYVGDGTYDHIYGALSQIQSWLNYFRERTYYSDSIREGNVDTYFRMKKIEDSKIYQKHAELFPAIYL